MSFVGGIMVAFFGGVGLISVPYDLIYDYVFMPQPIEEKDFTHRKQLILNYSLKLRDMAKSLESERVQVGQIRGFSGWRKRRAFSKKLRIFEARALLAEKEYTFLDLEANYFQKVEPLKYTFKLFLGIIAALLTLNWLVQT
jgi:LMBR1 domain-containing protein 1